ncbi:hypothetical protein FANTH_6272 [Fusarium anthophilum]|uniref:Uncharacterized protein n=1 Tax=Fusarium anthophilum TaxID=48485 RepID=A0A8H4ZL21_9HYPO|nr:hypothetical protein FANTH_6272 [Fusarium anthophilum]
MATCHKFRSILLKTRALTVRSSTTGQRFTFDVEREALLVRGANIPALLEDDDVPYLHAVRRLISLRQCSIGWESLYPMDREVLLLRMPWAINATEEDRVYTSFEEGLPFQTSFPVAQKLCSLREMDLVIQHAPGWHISSLQQFGPRPEHRRTEPVLGDLKHPVHHTGLRWTNPRLEDYRWTNLRLEDYRWTNLRLED